VRSTAANLLVLVVALLHVYFLVLEMFLWDTPFGRRVFRLTPEFSGASKGLAANQGLYNGFLAAGLVYGVVTAARPIEVLFLIFVIVAGAFGALTVNRRIFWIQAAPAILALGLLWFP
jgi:putative membrane protein